MSGPTERGAAPRWQVVVEEGPPHGGLHELEVDTTHRVLDRRTGEVVLEVRGEYSASFGDDGNWGPGETSGAVKVEISADQTTAVVHGADGSARRFRLPV